MSVFQLYTQEKRIFTFDDYGALIAECRRIKAKSVLEFGPGTSTLTFVEAGCARIVTCEYQDEWLAKAQEMLKPWPQVSVHRFLNALNVEVQGLSRHEFDLAFVDSPLGVETRRHVDLPGQEGCSRLNTMMFALERAPVVLLHDAKREGEQCSLARLREMGHAVETIETAKGIARILRHRAVDAAPLS